MASRVSGALTIYRQFIYALEKYKGPHHFYVFIDSSMDHPQIDGVTYITEDNHSWFNRLRLDWWGIKKWVKKNRLQVDKLISDRKSVV